MNDLLPLFGGDNGRVAQIVAWLVSLQAALKVMQPLLVRGVNWLADRLDDMIDQGRTDGALLLALVRSNWWLFAVFVFDLLFRVKLPTEASLEARWDRIKREREALLDDAEARDEIAEHNSNLDGTGLMALVAALGIGAAVFTGCARFSTTQTDLSYEDGKPVRQITTRASASTLFTAKSALANFKASQTDKTQGASVGSLSQETSGTNTVRALEAVAEILKSVK